MEYSTPHSPGVETRISHFATKSQTASHSISFAQPEQSSNCPEVALSSSPVRIATQSLIPTHSTQAALVIGAGQHSENARSAGSLSSLTTSDTCCSWTARTIDGWERGPLTRGMGQMQVSTGPAEEPHVGVAGAIGGSVRHSRR